ncbi:DUF1499 domain-containing protein [Oceaniglobus roseus]|uniref:DUF1499 domain-containing protein n=1 Tax=Oceaniglobus roseus TaxID=1737570 RepID=UPI003184161D
MILWIVLAVIVAALAYVRLAPSDPARWNVDPLSVEAPEGNGWLVRPEGGNAAGEVFACAPEVLLEELDRIAMNSARTRRLAGSVAEGQITYVSRSRVFGFPDYTTVSSLATAGGSTPVLFGRQRFGMRDLGVNEARVKEWLAALGASTKCPKPS